MELTYFGNTLKIVKTGLPHKFFTLHIVKKVIVGLISLTSTFLQLTTLPAMKKNILVFLLTSFYSFGFAPDHLDGC